MIFFFLDQSLCELLLFEAGSGFYIVCGSFFYQATIPTSLEKCPILHPE